MNDNNPGADRSPEQLEARAKARELRRAQRRSRASRHDPGTDEPGDGTEGYAPSASGAAATPVRPPAQPARLKKRHLGVGLGMVLMVLVPLLATTVYLYVFAQDQYASNTGFTVRSEETSSATELAGGLTALVGGSNSSNADVLYAYIQSQQIVERIQEQLDIRAHFSENWGIDPVFSIWPDASIEDLLWFWGRIMRVSYDQASGLMDVQIRANSAEYAQELARLVVHESEEMINQL
ncbi:MAG: sugar transporter, partial [Pararhodobacter sp.]|nr:sugar transporter [Pararhodobacter sp.]